LAAVCIGLLIAAGTIYAAATVPDVIKMEEKAYSKHTKGIVEFDHKKHHEEYKLGCGECHHDANGKALTGLKAGDDVKACIECHKIPGKMPGEVKKEMREKKASKKEMDAKKLEYQAEAMHENCIGCHKEYDSKNKTKAAPTSCTKCHKKS
jgi:Class III cytochrome C family